MVLTDQKAEEVFVESASVAAEVTGGIAVTTFDLVFRNPNGRVLEGTFEFPLLDGQNVVRFGLDINGALREAVPIEKEKGRVVFEEIERRGIDPGLLEQTAGNNYRARIYPIPAGGTRRVVIAYQENLRRGGAVAAPDYKVALAFARELKHFKLAVAVLGGEADKVQARTTLALPLPSWKESRRLEVERENFKAEGVVELRLPALAAPAVITGTHGQDEYFVAELPVPTGVETRVRPAPKVLGLLWDVSGSGARRDHARELAMLDALFEKLGSVTVKLTLLRDRAEKAGDFVVKKGNWASLRKALERVDYDGASSIDGLVDDAEVDEWLLISDGILNYGVGMTAKLLPLAKPVSCALGASGGNADWLRGVARRSGGEFADLFALDAAAAAEALRRQSLRVLAVAAEKGAFGELFPEPGTPLAGGLLRVAGRLRSEMGTVRVSLGHEPGDARVVELVVRSGENPSALAARGWAQEKIRALSAEAAANREDIRRTSREFCILTPDTSLIVLETLEDYIRYAVTPPAELRREWDLRKGQRETIERGEKASHLEQVARRFATRVEWWERKYPKDGYKPSKRLGDIGISRAPAPAAGVRRASNGTEDVEETITLSPFSVSAPEDGYRPRNTLAGSRVRSDVREAVASVTVANDPASAPVAGGGRQFLRDSGASSTEGLLTYTANTEVGGNRGGASVSLRPWNAEAGYLERLRRAIKAYRMDIYLEEKEKEGGAPGFYLDVAEFFLEEGEEEKALRVLSNLAELGLEDAGLLRVLAARLVQAGKPTLAVPLYEQVLRIRGEEPQSYRDLALCLAEVGERQRAIDLLYTLITRPWHDRFPDVEIIALEELNAIVATSPSKLDTSAMDPRLLRNLPVGLRVVLAWDADNCDIDLWVRDSNGEDVGYSHSESHQGGLISRDFTGGYGPECFALRDPKPGKYRMRVNYFGDNRQNSFGPVTASVLVYTDFGTPKQKLQRMTLRLSERKEDATVGEVEVED